MTQEEKNEAIGIAFEQLRDFLITCIDEESCDNDVILSVSEYIEEVLQEC